MAEDRIISNKSDLVAIADTIRSKLETTDKYYVSELAPVIDNELVKLPMLNNEGSSSDLLTGKELIDKNGNKVIGTIPIKSAETIVPSTTDKTIEAGVYLNEPQTIKGDVNLVPDNIRAGVSIFDVTGTADVNSDGGTETTSVSPKDINFYDYEGTLLHSYTIAEAQELTKLPDLPSHKGLVCQGWNWTLEQIIAENSKVNVGAMYTTDDGKTRIYIHLEEGRLSPMVGLCVNGTATVDWGDGSEVSTLTGTSTTTVVFTSNHTYASAGDYVVTLDIDGEAGIKGSSRCALIYHSSSGNTINYAYNNVIKKIEIGDNIISISDYSFWYCYSLSTISIPCTALINDGSRIFSECYSLKFVTIPAGSTYLAPYMFDYCYSLSTVSLPPSLITIKDYYQFEYCKALSQVTIPKSVESNSLYSTFRYCYSLLYTNIPPSVTKVDYYTFQYCYGATCFDFSNHTSVPTLANTKVFEGIPSDCKILVPSSLLSKWKSATNWSTYASYMVGV